MKRVFIAAFALCLLTRSISFAQESPDVSGIDKLVQNQNLTFLAKTLSSTSGDLRARYYDITLDGSIMNPQQALNFLSTQSVGSPYLREFYFGLDDNFQRGDEMKKVGRVIIKVDKKGIISYAPKNYYPKKTHTDGEGVFLDKRELTWKAAKRKDGKWIIKMFYPKNDLSNENKKMFLEIHPDKTAVLTVASSGMPTLFYNGIVN